MKTKLLLEKNINWEKITITKNNIQYQYKIIYQDKISDFVIIICKSTHYVNIADFYFLRFYPKV